MHHSRLCALLIDCKTADVDGAAHFWAEALGRSVDLDHPGSRDNYRMLETPSDEPIVQIQRVEHESRVHIEIETDDIPAEVMRLEKLGAKIVDRLERWVVMQAPPASGSAWSSVQVSRRMPMSGAKTQVSSLVAHNDLPRVLTQEPGRCLAPAARSAKGPPAHLCLTAQRRVEGSGQQLDQTFPVHCSPRELRVKAIAGC